MEPNSHGLVAHALEVIRNVCETASTVRMNKPECERMADRFSAIGEGLKGVGRNQNVDVHGKAIDGSGERKTYPDLHGMLKLLRRGEVLVSECRGIGPSSQNFQAEKQLEVFQKIHRELDTLKVEFDFESYRHGLGIDSETISGTGPTTEAVSSLASDTDTKGDVILPTYLRIDPSDIHRRHMIGKGGNAEVYEATWLDCRCAVKVFRSRAMSIESISKLQKELDFLIRLRHPYMIQLMGLSVDSGHRCSIVMEMMSCSLRELIDSRLRTGNRSVPFDLYEAVSIIKKIALGMAFVHSKGVAHRDLKAANVMVEERPGSIDVKIADFGESQFIDPDKAYGTAGTTAWMAPEILPRPLPAGWSKHRKPDLKATDVYSFAMLCYEVLTGEKPFSGTLKREQYGDVRSGRLRPVLPVGLNTTLKGLIEACWNSKPGKRPNFEIICYILNQRRNFDIPVAVVSSNSLSGEGKHMVSLSKQMPFLKALQSRASDILKISRSLACRPFSDSELKFFKKWYPSLIPEYMIINPVDLIMDKQILISKEGEWYKQIQVYQATLLGCEFAVKVYRKDFLFERRVEFWEEILLMKRLRHPNIVQVVGFSIDSRKKTISMVMEKMNCSLQELIDSRMENGKTVPFDLHEAVLILAKIALGMAFMHSRQVAHLSLEPGNVMVNEIHGSIDVKISGFGQSYDFRRSSRSWLPWLPYIKIDTVYRAPELKPYDQYEKFEVLQAGDIYSFAMTCYHVITGHAPFLAPGEDRPKLPANLPHNLDLLITECWHADPLRRVQFADIWFMLLSIHQKLLSSSS